MYPQAYLDYLIYFHTQRDYFECHEVLEEHWKESPDKDKIWVGLIQIAVGSYHYRRGNYSGALKMMTAAYLIFDQSPSKLSKLGLNAEQTIELVQHMMDQIKNQETFQDMNLPIEDKQLLEELKKLVASKNLVWGATSDVSDEYIIHKHTLRDRQEVIKERKWQKIQRSKVKRNQN